LIRKVYIDFLRNKLSNREFRWLISRGTQYVLTYASMVMGKPLCGPILGTLVTNYSCNYRCTMCDLSLRDKELRGRGLKEFDTARMIHLLTEFARLGTSGIGFTGGEPLLRKDLFELLVHTKSLGMISHLNTNAFYLDDANARNIIDAKVDSLNISLDGARASTHDAIRGYSGAFDRAVNAVGRMVALRERSGAPLRIKTVAVISEKNVDEVKEMVALARDLHVDCIEFIPCQTFRSDAGGGTAIDPAFLEKIDAMTKYLAGLEHRDVKIENSPTHLRLFGRSFRNEKSPLRCFAGYNSLSVDCYGEVYPCVPWYNWRRAAGNVAHQDLRDFWYSAEYNKVRREVAGCRKCYLNCQAELNILFNPFTR